MPQIRRQPRRKTRRQELHGITNPFHQCLPYLPPPMAKKIQHLDKVILRHIDELLTEPENDLGENLLLIREALKRQETAVNEIKDERETKKSQSPTE